jgi:hypothetical protein
MEETENQQSYSKGEHLRPFQWKKGQSGNIMGRPKGKTMKDYVRQYLERMTDEERDEWLEGLPKEIIWKMAEGNPKQDTEIDASDNMMKVLGINYITPDGNKSNSNE